MHRLSQGVRKPGCGLNIQYAYPATQNNGKIASETDMVSGEQVTYTYDSLNRLATATSSVSPGWGQSYTYDGFGNLTNQTTTKGSAPGLSTTYDPATNRQTGDCADANGNLGCGGYVYDAENRLTGQVQAGYTPPIVNFLYSYAPGNKRVWRGDFTYQANGIGWIITQTADEVTFWGANGQKLAMYALSVVQPAYSAPYLVATQTGTNYYFGGKLIKNTGGYVATDRLGSLRKFFPYGQERPSATTNGTEKFATYFRDSETGLDYADQRYHQPGMGRFMTPDPYGGSASARDPGSWNRYAYSGGDPVNNSDPSGLDDTDTCNPARQAFNPAFFEALCDPNYQNLGNISNTMAAATGLGNPLPFDDPNPSVFAYDLGQVGPGSGNDPLAFSAAYDLNNGAPGFGPPDPGAPPPKPDCQSQILNAVNNQFGDNFTSNNVTNEFQFSAGAPPGQGTLNLNISVPASSQPDGVSAGRYPINWWTYIVGYGPTLHVPAGPGGADSPQTLPLTPSQFTVHIDSSLPYNPIGFAFHLLLDMTPLGGYKQCP